MMRPSGLLQPTGTTTAITHCDTHTVNTEALVLAVEFHLVHINLVLTQTGGQAQDAA